MSNNNSKKNNNVKLIIIVLVILVVLVIGVALITKKSGSNNLSSKVGNTNLEKSESYKMDLRIYGTYNNKSINDIIMVSNYKDTDKEISVTSGEKEEKYLVKDGKKYKLENEKLTDVNKVPYENTEVYLKGLNKLTKVKQKENQTLGKTTYKVYEGVISSKDMSDIIKETNLDIKLDKDIKTEVWLTKDDYVYKIYYKLDNLTIYPSYFGYGKMNKIDLDMYK